MSKRQNALKILKRDIENNINKLDGEIEELTNMLKEYEAVKLRFQEQKARVEASLNLEGK